MPREFNKKSERELRFDNYANQKAWMTRVLFFEGLKCFDNCIAKKVVRKVLLLFDNCTAHGSEDNFQSLNHVKVLFVPPVATSHIQSCDKDTIAYIKRLYKSCLLMHILEYWTT